MQRSIRILCILGFVGASFSFPNANPKISAQTGEASFQPTTSYYFTQLPSVYAYESSPLSSAAVASTNSVFQKLQNPPSVGTILKATESENSLNNPVPDPLQVLSSSSTSAKFIPLETTYVNPVVPLGTLKAVAKRSSRKFRQGKSSFKTNAPAADEEDYDDEEQANETEADDVGGYPETRNSQPRQRQRSSQREQSSATGGYPSSFDESDNNQRGRSRQREGSSSSGVSGGYPSSFDDFSGNQRGRSSQREQSPGTGGYPFSFDASGDNQRGRSRPREGSSDSSVSGGYPSSFDDFDSERGRSGEREGSSASGVTGGYPSSFDDNDGTQRGRSSQRDSDSTGGYPSSFADDGRTDFKKSSRTRSRSRLRSRNNRPSVEDEEAFGEAENDESLSGEDDSENPQEINASRNQAAETEDELDYKDDEEQEERRIRNQSRFRSNKRGRSGRREKTSDNDDEDYDADEPTVRKPKNKKTSQIKKSRPASQEHSGRRGRKNNARQNLARAQEPSSEYGVPQGRSFQEPSSEYGAPEGRSLQEPSSVYGAPEGRSLQDPSSEYGAPEGRSLQEPSSEYGAPRGRSLQEPSSEYGAPRGRSLQEPSSEYGAPRGRSLQEPSSEYGAPRGRSLQSQQNRTPKQSKPNTPKFSNPRQQNSFTAEISPPLPRGAEGGYRTINTNVGRGRTSNPPQLRQRLQQEYNAPSQSSGLGRRQVVGQRQKSRGGAVFEIPDIPNGNSVVSEELIKAVLSIYEKNPV